MQKNLENFAWPIEILLICMLSKLFNMVSWKSIVLTFLHVRILSISLNLILFRCVPKGVDFLKKDGTFRRCRILIYMLLSVFLLSAIILQTGCSWFSSKDLILTVIESNGSEEDRQLQRDCIEEYVQAFENTYEQTVKVQYVKDIPAELSETDVILVGCDGALEYMADKR